MINCGDPAFGVNGIPCPKCSNLKFVPFSCKKVFCLMAASYFARTEPTPWLSNSSYAHRHCVFLLLIEDLRHFFLEDRSLFLTACFMLYAVSFSSYVFQVKHVQELCPWFCCVLHTFGRPLEWNPPYPAAWLQKAAFQMTAFGAFVKHFDYTLLHMSFLTAR